MTTKTLIIKQLSRTPKTGDFDELNFEPGVNVLVGNPNTGKTQWLRMLDFLMGDRESNPVNAFDEDLVNKYDSIKGVFLIGDEEITLERFWKQPGNKGKVFIDGNAIIADTFSSYLLSLLDIPAVHYPQGNPLSPRTWPELSWRSLLRHIYRKQTSWGELASKQPEVEQHACILMFLGIAEHLFSTEYEQLAEKQKEIYKQEAG